MSGRQESAYSLLRSGKFSGALDLNRESDKVRDRYGRHLCGQSLLLARRFAAADVPIVQVSMGIVQAWDTHYDNFSKLKNELLPQLDQSVAALIDDLSDRAMLDQTLVVVVGEFGRSPAISTDGGKKPPGREHWASVYTVLFSGGGVYSGQVIGKSDKDGAFPLTSPYHPNDLGATIYQALGVDSTTEVQDRFDRQLRINRGKVMQALYTGAVS